MKLFSTSLLCLVAVVGLSSLASGQNWKKTYNGSGNSYDVANSVAADYAGNTYVTGESQGATSGTDIVTIKYSATGAVLWSRRYDSATHGNDSGKSIAYAYGDVYVLANSESATNGTDMLLIKYDSNGNRQWVSRYDGPGHGADTAVSVISNADGGVYVAGTSEGTTTGADFVVIKYNSDGTKAWLKRYDGPGHGYDIAVALATDTSGGVAIAGTSTGTTTGLDYAVVKYDRDGNRQWVRRYNGARTDLVHGLFVAESGDVIVTGNSWVSATRSDFLTIAWDISGNLKWSRRYNAEGSDDAAWAIGGDVNGNYYVTGSSTRAASGKDIVTIKYDSDGNVLWTRSFDGSVHGDEIPTAMLIDGVGDVYVAGTTWVGNVDYNNILLLKYDTDGNLASQRSYQGTGHGNDFPTAIAQGINYIVLTGFTFTSATPTSTDYITISYAP